MVPHAKRRHFGNKYTVILFVCNIIFQSYNTWEFVMMKVNVYTTHPVDITLIANSFCGFNFSTEWVSVWGLTSHATHTRSFRRQVFSGSWLHWYWQPKSSKQNTAYTLNTKDGQKKPAVAGKAICILIWYAFCDLRPGNGVGPILTAHKELLFQKNVDEQ